MSEWTELGRIIRTQIHTAEVVHDGRYDASLIREVSALWLTAAGVVGIADEIAMLDYHHADHPELRTFKPGRQLSVGFSGHYMAMERKFGSAPIGIAAENIVVDFPGRVTEAEIAAGVMIRSDQGTCELASAAVARPCVPFTRFLLDDVTASSEVVAEHRAFLADGMRGYVMSLVGLEAGFRVGVGDVVYRRSATGNGVRSD